MATARLSVDAIVSMHSASVTDAPSYIAACGAIDSLVTAGQVTSPDASAAKAKLAEVMATAIARKSASKTTSRITVVARRLDTMYDDNSSADAKKAGAKVAGKGNVCVYGLQRFPLALYPSQWERLFGLADEVRAAIKANADSLDTSK